MAASTWFHGSQWPPSNHGIMPSWRCTSAMAWPVASTSELERMPGTSGSVIGGTDLLGRHAAAPWVGVVGPRRPGTPRGTLGRASGSPATAASGLVR